MHQLHAVTHAVDKSGTEGHVTEGVAIRAKRASSADHSTRHGAQLTISWGAVAVSRDANRSASFIAERIRMLYVPSPVT